MSESREGTREGTKEHFYEVLKDFDTGMLVTRAPDGHLRSRPMTLAEVEACGDLYFVTSLESPKVEELGAEEQVNVALQGKTRFASVSGRAEVTLDRARIDRLWREPWKVWFPKGKEDPSLCLLRVSPEEGEFWDNAGTKGLRYLFEAAKAYVEGTTPPTDRDQNARVRL